MLPTSEQAIQFATMLRAGLPASDAILYFTDSTDPREVGQLLQDWQKSRAVRKAMLSLMGKPWEDMTLDEQCRYALDLHYAGLAYFLYSHNYSEVGQQDQVKLNTARAAIEAKLAGTAGKTDALTAFFEDVRAGRVKLQKPATPPGVSNTGLMS
jgi:hypothetical protein